MQTTIIILHMAFIQLPVPYRELFWSRYTSLGSQTQTLKNVKINSSKNRQLTFHTLVPQCVEQREECFELLRMQNSQNFPGICYWTPLRRACSAPSRLLSCTMVFLATLVKKPVPPKKLLDTALTSFFEKIEKVIYYKLVNVKVLHTWITVYSLHNSIFHCWVALSRDMNGLCTWALMHQATKFLFLDGALLSLKLSHDLERRVLLIS